MFGKTTENSLQKTAERYLFLKENSAKKIYDMSVILGEKRPSYCTVKNWVAGFGTGHLSTEDKKHSERQTQATVPENVDAIHSMILDDRRISSKKRLETLAITRERVGYIISHILYVRKSQPSWFSNLSTPNRQATECLLNRSVIECLLHKQFWTDFDWILWDFLTAS
jgi:hypothetical protein